MSDSLKTHWEILAPTLYRVSWRILGHAEEVQDVLQDVVLEAITVAERQEIINFPGFLKRLTVCRSLDQLRRRKISTPFIETQFVAKQESAVDRMISDELEARLREAISQLTNRQAEVFSLRYFDGLNNLEIAEVLEISVPAVATALHKSRTRLASLMSIETKESP